MRWTWGDDPDVLRRCVEEAGILGLPTESSYALGVDPRSEEAVRAVFEVKRRAATEPLGVVVADAEQASALGVDVSGADWSAAARIWPAALNVLFEVAQPLPAMSGAERLSLRIPEHSGLRQVLSRLQTGLTATSANLSGEPAIVEPDRLDRLLTESGARYVVVDDGVLPGGLPSTMVVWETGAFRVLREGRTAVPDPTS